MYNPQPKPLCGILAVIGDAAVDLKLDAWKAALPIEFRAKIRFERKVVDLSIKIWDGVKIPKTGPPKAKEMTALRHMGGGGGEICDREFLDGGLNNMRLTKSGLPCD